MTSKKTEDLTASGTLDGTELVHVVKGGNSRKTTAQAIANLAPSGATTLSALTDVNVSTPPTNGQALVYDAASSKWKAGAGSGGTTLVQLDTSHDWGASPASGSGSSYNGGIWFGNLVTIDSDGWINTVVYALNGAKTGINGTPVIYANNAGAAGAVLAQGPTVANAVAGDNVLPLSTPLQVHAGDQLWIGCYQANIGSIVGSLTTASATSKYFIDTLPVNNPGGTLTDWGFALRIFGRGTGLSTAGLVNLADVDESTVAPTDGQALVYNAASSKWRPATIAYNVPFAFTATPTANEVMLIHVFTAAVVFPDEWVGAQKSVGINPSASFVMTVKKNGSAVGSITIGTGGAVTFTTTGTTVSFAAGDVLSVTAPSTVDPTVANVAITLKGAL
jgi:hypothetical protein